MAVKCEGELINIQPNETTPILAFHMLTNQQKNSKRGRPELYRTTSLHIETVNSNSLFFRHFPHRMLIMIATVVAH